MNQVAQDRITVYRIPPDTVRFVLGTVDNRRIFSPKPIAPGLYLREAMRPSVAPGLMCLIPADHEATFYIYTVQVADVDRFAQSFVPEDHLLLDAAGALAAICSEYVQRRQSEHLSCPSPRPELGCPGPAAGPPSTNGGAL